MNNIFFMQVQAIIIIICNYSALKLVKRIVY